MTKMSYSGAWGKLDIKNNFLLQSLRACYWISMKLQSLSMACSSCSPWLSPSGEISSYGSFDSFSS